jgi:FkbM family methyltransferase
VLSTLDSGASTWLRRIGRLRRIDPASVLNLCRRSLARLNVALQRSILGKRLFERPINDYRLLLDATDPGINRQLLEHGTREREQMFLLEQHLRPGMRVFDLGANIGYYTVLMARRVGSQGRVYAVEPHPKNYRLLCENVRHNKLENVELENIAIDVRDGERPLLVSERCNWHSFHDPELRADAQWATIYKRRMVRQLDVRTRSLGGYLAVKPALDLMRMDLEGYEVEILDALSELPRTMTRGLHILMETHPEFYDPMRHDMRRVLMALHARHGYRATHLICDFYDGTRGSAHTEAGREVFARYGYDTSHILEPRQRRPIYTGVSVEHAIDLICTSENVHAVMLEPS